MNKYRIQSITLKRSLVAFYSRECKKQIVRGLNLEKNIGDKS